MLNIEDKMDCDEISALFSYYDITVEGAEKKSGAAGNQVRTEGGIFIRVEQSRALTI